MEEYGLKTMVPDTVHSRWVVEWGFRVYCCKHETLAFHFLGVLSTDIAKVEDGIGKTHVFSWLPVMYGKGWGPCLIFAGRGYSSGLFAYHKKKKQFK
jgi:hypothetical protein